MIVCANCEEEFEDDSDFEAHIQEVHHDLVNEALQEYISDAEKDVALDLRKDA